MRLLTASSLISFQVSPLRSRKYSLLMLSLPEPCTKRTSPAPSVVTAAPYRRRCHPRTAAGGHIHAIDAGERVLGQRPYGHQHVALVARQVVGQEGGHCFDFLRLDAGPRPLLSTR